MYVYVYCLQIINQVSELAVNVLAKDKSGNILNLKN